MNLENIDDVKGLQSNLRATFESDAGKEVMKFLEQVCGWYDFYETDTNKILVAHGKRQVLATIKTLLTVSAEQVSAIIRQNKI